MLTKQEKFVYHWSKTEISFQQQTIKKTNYFCLVNFGKIIFEATGDHHQTKMLGMSTSSALVRLETLIKSASMTQLQY